MCKKQKKTEQITNSRAVLITEESDDIDVLDRKSFIDQVIKTINYYSEKRERISFSIQGTWGSGKSWIVNKIINELYDVQDFDNCGSKFCIFSYNAWDYDYYDEPLISLFISLYKQLNNENAVLIKNEETRKKVNAFLDTIKDKFLKDLKEVPFIGNLIDFKQSYDNKLEDYDAAIRKYDYHFDINQIMEATLKGLNKIANENKTIVLFVDELDRCLPEYAVKVLERIHHIKQYVNNIQIIYSIDKEQLTNIIERTFGNKNSINDYLAKFIDFGYKLPPSTFNTEINKKFEILFEQFDFINCVNTTTITELVKSLLPESIPIRIHQAMLKKIIFINNQLNTSNSKKDYSILIAELFIAIAEQVNMKWNGTYFDFNRKRGTVELLNQRIKSQYQHPQEINDFISKIACTGIFHSIMTINGEKLCISIDRYNANINSLVLYYIARLIEDDQYYSYDRIDYLPKNDEYLKNFHSYYRALEM